MHVPVMAQVAWMEDCGTAAAAIADDFLLGRWPHPPLPFKDHDRMRCLVEHACRWGAENDCHYAVTKASCLLPLISNVIRSFAFTHVASL